MLALRGPHFFYSADEMEERVDRLAAKIASVIESGTVAIHSDTSVRGIELILSCMRLGLRMALCPVREPAAVLDEWLNDLDCSLLLSTGARDSSSVRSVDYDELLLKTPQCYKKSGQFSTIIRTSGSTGTPKNALILEDAHQASARAVNHYFDYTSHSSWLLSLPLYHVSGFAILMRAIDARAEVFLPDKGANFKDLSSSFSHCSVVPTQLARFLHEVSDFSSCKALIVGGDALGGDLRAQALARKWPIYETYGMTETASMIWVSDPSAKKNSGLLPHAHLHVNDDQEILVKGESLCEGYISRNILERPFDPLGYFPTKDMGFIDGANQLHINGRKNNRIISGGENIQAEEIERIIEMHPAVERCVVVGKAHPEFGARPIAFIKWVDDKATQDLSLWLKRHLASFKHPDAILLWPKDISLEGKKPRAKLAQRL